MTWSIWNTRQIFAERDNILMVPGVGSATNRAVAIVYVADEATIYEVTSRSRHVTVALIGAVTSYVANARREKRCIRVNRDRRPCYYKSLVSLNNHTELIIFNPIMDHIF